MKTAIFIFAFIFCFVLGNAQQKDYKPLLDTFFLYAEKSFKDIAGKPNDTSAFSPAKLKVDVGELKVGRYPYVTTLVWKIPLKQAAKIHADVQEYIRIHFSGKPNYQLVSDGTEEEGYKVTEVYAVKENEKPVVFFRTIYYKAENEQEKSSFTVMVYGK
ncbi:hypothetical protein [Niabella hirudinis]|uniref:hypothetical protein n=1 Tax=Niabella hirudinis TaxID=1285929 RepID=UPI003EBEDCB0